MISRRVGLAMGLASLFVGGLAPVVLSQNASSQIFLTAPSYSSGAAVPYHVEVGDFNGDGVADLVVANECVDDNCAVGAITVLLGKGDGTFQAAQSYSLPGRDAASVTIADFNRDGKLDLAVANQCTDNACTNGSVTLLLGNGDGTFKLGQTYISSGSYSSSITIGDFNRDGKIDLAVSSQCADNTCTSGSVTVFLGNGDGTFQKTQTYVPGGGKAFWVTAGDFNGDANTDLALATDCTQDGCAFGTVSVLLGNGDGTFQVAQTFVTGAGLATRSVTIADFNGDGKADLAVHNLCASNGNCSTGSVSVLLGNGDGTFQTAKTYSTSGTATAALTTADFNGDGKPDLVVADECGNNDGAYGNCDSATVAVLLGNGDGTFHAAQSYTFGGSQTHALTVGDFTGSGKIDLAVTSACVDNTCKEVNGIISILLGNGDGTFKAALAYSTTGLHDYSVAQGDLNNDGKTDLVVANQCSDGTCTGGSLTVLLGNGDGTFQVTGTYASGGVNSYSVTLGDLNGDGYADLAVANQCTDSSCTGGSVSVLLGNGDGTFQTARTYTSTGMNDYSVTVGDFNGDGRLDLAVTNECADSNCLNGSVSVLLGNGDGTFQAAQSYATGGINSYSVTAVDLNGDGKVDLAVADQCATSNCASGSVSVLLGNGDGTFQAPGSYSSRGVKAYSITAADFNGDGKPDLAVANQCADSTCTSGNISVLLGNGDGTFQTAQTYASGGVKVSAVLSGDFNGDGKTDLFAPNQPNSGLLLGNGDGTFQSVSVYNSGAKSAIPGDFSRHGRLDVALVSGDGVTILLNFAEIASTVTISSSTNPSRINQSVTFTATVTSRSGGIPTGTVTFKDGSTAIGSAGVSGNTASISVSTLTLGTHSITAVYSGDASLAGSSSGAVAQVVNKQTTASTVSSSANPAIVGSPVTFSVTVSPQLSGAPTGTVTMKKNAGTLATLSLNAGQTSFTTSSLGIGSSSITAVYGGDSNFSSSTSPVLTQVVSKSFTSASVTSSQNPSNVGQSVTFVATVTSGSGAPPDGEIVAFKNGSTTMGTGALSGGNTFFTTSSLLAGSHSITAVYVGDATYATSTSPAFTQTIGKYSTASTLASSANPSNSGQSVTFTATISSSSGTSPDGEVVTFKDGSTTLGTGSLTGGTATFTTSSLAAGTRSITATYSGDTKFAPSTSPKFTETVNRYSTAATVTSSGSPSTFGQSVTFTSTVSSPSGQTISGTVTFKSGGTTLATQTFTGTNTLTISTLPVGTHAITVVYNGDATNAPSTSPAVSQVVTKATTSTNLVSSVNPSTAGQAVIFTATVFSSTTGIPTGTVTFKSGTAVLGTVSLSSGSASLTTSSLASGSHSITATYNGSGSFTTSSTTLTQVVN
jgi:hypothetical protein